MQQGKLWVDNITTGLENFFFLVAFLEPCINLQSPNWNHNPQSSRQLATHVNTRTHKGAEKEQNKSRMITLAH